MSDAIIVALITGGLALIGQIIVLSISNKELYSKLDKQSELADERMRGEITVIRTEITDLRHQVEKHNSVIERTYTLEKEQAKQAEQIKTLFNQKNGVSQ